MYYVYVLKSKKWNRPYIGRTIDLKNRVKQHNNKNTKSTRYGIPWTPVYYEAYLSLKDAVKREMKLKKYGSAFGFLKRRISNSMSKA